MSTKVLVTGASGFIGSHLVELLVNEGYSVRALVRDANSSSNNLVLLPNSIRAGFEQVCGDLRDREAVTAAMSGCEIIFHLGAIISVPYSVQYPEETLAININGTLNILQAMQQHEVARGVIVSTSAVYGITHYTPIDENHPLHALSPYGASKIAAESLSMSFYHSYNTPIVIVRPFNAYGPRQSTRAVIPSIIGQALQGEGITLGATNTIRDFTYAADTAQGMLLASQTDQAIGHIVNLGSMHGVSIAEIAEKIVTLIGRSVPIHANDEQRTMTNNSEIERLEADNRLATSLLGWQPEISLETGLQRTIAWMREHPEQIDSSKSASR